MASNVFGTPITDRYLKALPEYDDMKLSQKDRAKIALEMKNAKGKDVNAQKFGEALQQRHDDGQCAAIVLIYNATGNPLIFRKQYHWNGRLSDSPVPTRIENCQWGVFVQGKSASSPNAARAAVIYTGKAPNDKWYDSVLSWSTSTNGPTNQVNVQIGKTGVYDNQWGELDSKLSATPLHDSRTVDKLVHMEASIGNSANTSVEAICTFYDLWYS